MRGVLPVLRFGCFTHFEQDHGLRQPALRRPSLGFSRGPPRSARLPRLAGYADVLRFRCLVGHALSADSLNDGQVEMMESALWHYVDCCWATRATDYAGKPEDQFVHSIVPIHSIDDGAKPQRLFIYTEKV